MDTILAERKQDLASDEPTQRKRFNREVEKFHKALLDKKYSINSARISTVGILQFFRFFEMPITLEKGSSVGQRVETTSDFVPTIEQYRSMFNCADLRGRAIISMALDLGWRISDFLEITKDDIPDLNQEPPLAFDRITEKEKVIAKSFLSAETVELLKTYMPTLDAQNPFLFQSNHEHHLDPESVGDVLKNLLAKAHVAIPKGKHIRFHAFRKRFLSTCADLKIDVNTAKILVGKNVESSMLAYLSEVNHKKAFLEVKGVLNLTNGRMKSTIEAKDAQIETLKKEVNELRLTIKVIQNLFGDEILEKAKNKVTIAKKSGKLPTAEEVIDVLIEVERKKQQDEYEKLLAEKNGNGDGA